MRANLLLARHANHAEIGKVLSGRSEIALDADGRSQAECLADRLGETRLGAIHSSPRRRAAETAERIARRHGRPVTIAPALDEIDFGAWAGQSFEALAADDGWRTWNRARDQARPPGGETMAEAIARVVAHVESTLAGLDGALLCVSHGDIIRGVVAHYLGLGFDRLLAFDVDPASLTRLAVGPWGGRLVSLNETVA